MIYAQTFCFLLHSPPSDLVPGLSKSKGPHLLSVPKTGRGKLECDPKLSCLGETCCFFCGADMADITSGSSASPSPRSWGSAAPCFVWRGANPRIPARTPCKPSWLLTLMRARLRSLTRPLESVW
ncbi:hypothetical protein LIA77_02543 [Sarocladium implicatum]|nr:hypothetical protein LIA77_02543 [Sarocladium implicatum]